MKFGYVKCGAYTPKVKVCDIEYNVSNIKEGILQAEKQGVELLCFPALSITGATIGDLAYLDTLLLGAVDGLKEIVDFSVDKDMLIFVGMPLKVKGLIYNTAVAINNGKVLGVIPKTNLINVGDSYEKRYFAPCDNDNTVINLLNNNVPFGKKIIFCDRINPSFRVGAELGEDISSPFSPSTYHATNGATIIVNLSSSAQTVGKKEYKENLIKMQSSILSCGYVLADAGYGESSTDLVFAGHNVIAENGKVFSQSKLFSNGLITFDIDTNFIEYERSKTFNGGFNKDSGYIMVEFSADSKLAKLDREYSKLPFIPQNNKEERLDFILSMQAEGLKKRIEHTNAKCVVLGLSGGLDSTLAIIVAITAMKKLNRSLKDVIAVTMPCFGTTSRTYLNTIKLAKSLNVSLKKIDISKSVTRHLKDIKHQEGVFDVTFENAQARERTQVIMDIANMNNGLVVGTGDLSELALGWATYNGDHMSNYGVNGDVPKTLIRHIVKQYADKSKGKLKAVLLDILDTPVSPELLPSKDGKISQKTEDIVGDYILHDFFLYSFIRYGFSPKKIYFIACRTFNGDFSNEEILKWLKNFYRRFFTQQFKRSCIPDGVKVGSVALSPRGDLKMPSDAINSLWLKELEEL